MHYDTGNCWILLQQPQLNYNNDYNYSDCSAAAAAAATTTTTGNQ